MGDLLGHSGKLAWVLLLAGVAWGTLATPAAGKDIRFAPTEDEAGRGLKLSPWLKVRPFARFSVIQTNNVLLEPTRARDPDLILISTGGLGVEAEGLNKSLRLGYAGTQLTYTRNRRLDAFEHRLRLGSDVTLDQLTVSVNATANKLVSPSDPQFTERIRRWEGGGNLTVDWTENEWLGFQIVGNWDFIDFAPRELDYYDQLGWGTSGFVSITPGLPVSLFVGGGYRELRYTNKDATVADYGLANASLGVDVKLFARLEGGARFGLERGWILVRRSTPHGQSKPRGVLAVGHLRWRPRLSDLHETTIVVSGGRRTTFSPSAPYQTNTTFFVSFAQELPFDLEFWAEGGYELQEPRGGDNLQSITANSGVAWSPFPQLELALQASFSNRRSRRSSFEEISGGGGLTLRY